jgi:hypothetical protein
LPNELTNFLEINRKARRVMKSDVMGFTRRERKEVPINNMPHDVRRFHDARQGHHLS